MLRNYVTVAMRSLVANRMHSLINIGGLAVGLAACLLILLFVRDELSYESWLPNADRIISVESTFNVPGREKIAFAATPGPMKPALDKDFSSDIERAVRIYGDSLPVRVGDRKFRGELTFVDPGFFEVFDLPMIAGVREPVLANNSSILLSETTAHKYFGDLPAIGNTITAGDNMVFTVIGVFADIPKNSHLSFEAIGLFDLERYTKQPWVAQQWTSVNTRIYLLLRTPEARERIAADMPAFVDRNVHFEIPGLDEKPSSLMEFDLKPVLDIHLHADKLGYDNTGSFTIVVAFAGIALLILMIACINFVNLATARAMTRAREVALRKVVGATRRQLVVQHLGEAILVALVALVLALAIVELALGPFNSFLHKQLRLELLGDPTLLVAMLALIVIVGVIGGLYPALYLSRFRPASVLKANQSSAAGSSRLRAALVVFQFAISIGLIICTAIIYAQTRYARTLDVGFAKSDRLTLQSLGDMPSKEARTTLKREIGSIPGVLGASLSSDAPPLHHNNNTLFYPNATPGNDKYVVETLNVDADFFRIYEIQPLAGRLFSADRASDSQRRDEDPDSKTQAIVVNEAFARKLGAKTPADVVGRVLWEVNGDNKPMTATTIIGVIPDLHLRSVRAVLTPLVYYYADPPDWLQYLTVHFDPAREREVMAAVEAVWNRLAPTVPIQTAYVEDDLAKQYDADEQRGQIFGGFAMFAILIACLGLFGLASFSAQRRTKEIGMRKVLGASVLDIVRLLVWQFSRPVLIASLIAWPLSFYVMRRWLAGFENAISITDPRVLAIFVAATLVAVAIAWFTTAGHAFRVARANPGRALRTE
jgi:putative ABC transport system permease protein